MYEDRLPKRALERVVEERKPTGSLVDSGCAGMIMSCRIFMEILGIQNPREDRQDMVAHGRVWKGLMKTGAIFRIFQGGGGVKLGVKQFEL